MKILLLGEYSNVHATLAQGLRILGHNVTVASNGDFWKNYPRDIDLARTPGKWGGFRLMAKTMTLLPRLQGYDMVQLINPMFLELKAERLFPIYKYLRRHNKRMVLGAFGMDWYWVNTCCETKPLRYSDFNIGNELRTNKEALTERRDWLGTAKGQLNQMIANDCDGIVTGLYEYDVCYRPVFPEKTRFIPLPIPMHKTRTVNEHINIWKERRAARAPLTIFIGISKNRSKYKGTDIMLRAAQNIKAKYPDKVELRIANGVPFDEYTRMMDGADLLLDQLYSYTPAMNALHAMANGIVVVGGGEPENYEILNETVLRPIVNVLPTYESVYRELENIVHNPEQLVRLKCESIEYASKYHDYITVAMEYVDFYQKLLP